MYQALYRKWRPQTFSDVIGQEHIVDTLKNQIIHNRISHAYLFCGSRGTGKTTTAKIFSRAVNCLHPVDGNPCNECDACLGILNGSNIDVVEIDAASNNKVDNIREIRDEVIYPPADVKYKVYIIDEAHMLTTSAFNALLKTLEEPPAYVIFILATTEFHKIPATILSRCQKFDFKRITYRDTAKRVQQVVEKDGLKVSSEGIKLLAKAADGSIRDALSILDQCVSAGKDEIGFEDIANILGASDPVFVSKLGNAVIEENISSALLMVNEAVYNGTDILKLSDDLIEYFRNLMIVKTTKKPLDVLDVSEETVAELEQIAKRIPLNRILHIIEVLFDTMSYAKFITNPKIALETAMLKIAAKETDRDMDAILNRIELLEQKAMQVPVMEAVNLSQQFPDTAERMENRSQTFVEEPMFAAEDSEENVLQEQVEVSPKENQKMDGPESILFDEGIPVEELLEQADELAQEANEPDPGEEPKEIPAPDAYAISEEEQDISAKPVDLLSDDVGMMEEAFDGFVPMEEEDLAEAFQSFAEEAASAEKEKPVSEESEDRKVSSQDVDRIVEGFAEIINDAAADADFAFRGIMERAEIQKSSETGNKISILFRQNSLYHIAKMSKYDKIIVQSVKRLFGLDIFVELEEKQQKKEEPANKGNPLDDVIQKIQEDDEIRFHLE